MEVGNVKKGFFTFLSATLMTAYLLPWVADAKESEKVKKEFIETVEVSNYMNQLETLPSVNNLDFAEISSELRLTKQDLIDLDKQLGNPEIEAQSIGIGAVLGIIATAIGLGGSLYAAGRYAARQTEVRLGLTSASYKKNRIYYRVGIAAAFGPAVALGFDDYFYGI